MTLFLFGMRHIFLYNTPHNAPKKHLKLFENNKLVPKHLAKYYANISWFDETVGLLIKYIEEKNLGKETIFIFLSDNGYMCNEQGKTIQSKRTPFELGIKTPILIRWDGKIKPSKYSTLVNSVDIVPTILGAAGLHEKIVKLPGINLLPLVQKKASLERIAVFGEIYTRSGQARILGYPDQDVIYRWIRSGPYKLIWPEKRDREKSDFMLFDVEDDPYEKNNLYYNLHYEDIRARLKNLLDGWWMPGCR